MRNLEFRCLEQEPSWQEPRLRRWWIAFWWLFEYKDCLKTSDWQQKWSMIYREFWCLILKDGWRSKSPRAADEHTYISVNKTNTRVNLGRYSIMSNYSTFCSKWSAKGQPTTRFLFRNNTRQWCQRATNRVSSQLGETRPLARRTLFDRKSRINKLTESLNYGKRDVPHVH